MPAGHSLSTCRAIFHQDAGFCCPLGFAPHNAVSLLVRKARVHPISFSLQLPATAQPSVLPERQVSKTSNAATSNKTALTTKVLWLSLIHI